MIRVLLLVGILFSGIPLQSNAVEIYSNFPAVIHPDERYVIYSHGEIVEGDNPTPVHPENGLYDFPKIKDVLFEEGGFNLIAYQRPKDPDIDTHVAMLESWVRHLLDAGVQPTRITLVGFSGGGYITAVASDHLRDMGLNTALMGACWNGDVPSDTPLVLGGRRCRSMRPPTRCNPAPSSRSTANLCRSTRSPSRQARSTAHSSNPTSSG